MKFIRDVLAIFMALWLWTLSLIPLWMITWGGWLTELTSGIP